MPWRRRPASRSHLSRATETRYRKMIELGLGGLDKSGIAELTFPNRSGNLITP